MTFVEHVRELRQIAGISRRKLSTLAGRSPTYWSQFESGARHEPSVELATAIMGVFGLEMAWINSGRNVPKPSAKAIRAAVERARQAQAVQP